MMHHRLTLSMTAPSMRMWRCTVQELRSSHPVNLQLELDLRRRGTFWHSKPLNVFVVSLNVQRPCSKTPCPKDLAIYNTTMRTRT
ncbi:hypothetical protein B0H34DRAFT_734761 [Crassisporium funariophilum]|nr:hypothetical protein B0H34DRAFT_734761 [Crassisporium funariophilum]